jgi:hypothetical protein
VIRYDANSVVVAIPDNTNSWPWYYQEEATKAATTYIPDPVLIGSRRVKVGEQVTNVQDTTRRDLGGADKPKVGEVVTSTNTTSVSDNYEYHLEFQKRNLSDVPNFSKPRVPAAPIPNGTPLTPAGGPAPGNASLSPADDIRIPPMSPPPSPSTSLPPTSIQGPLR